MKWILYFVACSGMGSWYETCGQPQSIPMPSYEICMEQLSSIKDRSGIALCKPAEQEASDES
jgi:hypothetical protein